MKFLIFLILGLISTSTQATESKEIQLNAISCSRYLTGEILQVKLTSIRDDHLGAMQAVISKQTQESITELARFKVYPSPTNAPIDSGWKPFFGESGTGFMMKWFVKESACPDGSLCNATISWQGLGNGFPIPMFLKHMDEKLTPSQLTTAKDEMKALYESRMLMGVTGFEVGDQSIIVYAVNSSVIENLLTDIPPQFQGVPVKFYVNPKPPKFDLDSVNSLCAEAGIGNFRVSGVWAFPTYPAPDNFDFPSNVHLGNYCRTAIDEIPESLKQTIAQITVLNQRVASLFGVSVKDLVHKMDLEIKGNPVGPLQSTSAVSIGVFPSWTGGELNSGIYLHELGHFISQSRNKNLPSALSRLKSYKLFVEGVADWLALTVAGSLPTRDGGLTGPLLKMRAFEKASSFDTPVGYFTYSYAIQHVKEVIEANPTQGDSPEAKNERMIYKTIVERFAEFPPIDMKPLSEVRDTKDLDPHLLGIPINAFFLTLKEKLGRHITSEFLEALRLNSEKSLFDPQFVCTIEGVSTPDEDKVAVTMPTVSGFLKQIRSLLKEPEKLFFDEAWSKHRLDIGFKLEEDTAIAKFVDWAAKDVMRERFQSNNGKGSGVYNPETKCYSKDYGIDINCVLTCTQMSQN